LLRQRRHVGAAGQVLLEDRHYLAHRGRARHALRGHFRQRGVDGGGHFLGRRGLGQEFLQHGEFALFLLGGFRAAGLLERGDGLAALLDLLFDDGGDFGVGQIAAFVHFLLLDGSKQESQRGQALGGLGAHRVLDGVGQAGLERSSAHR